MSSCGFWKIRKITLTEMKPTTEVISQRCCDVPRSESSLRREALSAQASATASGGPNTAPAKMTLPAAVRKSGAPGSAPKLRNSAFRLITSTYSTPASTAARNAQMISFVPSG